MNQLNDIIRSLRQSIEVINLKLTEDIPEERKQELLKHKESLEKELEDCLKKL